MQNAMYSIFNPQYHREQMMNAYNQYMNSLYPQQQNNVPTGYNIFPVSNIDEVNATKPDLNYNPTFFINQTKGEIYSKQLDRTTGAVVMKYYQEIQQPQQEPIKSDVINNQHDQKLNTILEGINGLYRLLSQSQEPIQEVVMSDVDVSDLKRVKGGKSGK